MPEAPTTVAFPRPLPVRRSGQHWYAATDGVEVRLSNLDKPFWVPEGYTKGDLAAYYWNVAPYVLPYVADRPLTLKRMPDGADGEFFYAKQAPPGTPDWLRRAAVRSLDSDKTVEYLLADDAAALLWLANLGCIELHPWHSRVDDLGKPDYAFFDLDPMGVGFDMVREVALLVRTVLDRLGLHGYARTSGATGIQIYVPIERRHDFGQVRDWVGRVCELINRADPDRTTMEWAISARTGKVFLDHNMNTEGRNIAAAFSLRPERGATVSTPVTWEEIEAGVEPGAFTITTIWTEIAERDALFRPVLAGGQDLREAMAAVGLDPGEEPEPAGHVVDRLAPYRAKRDFTRTPEPAPTDPGEAGNRFVIQHHLATRLHHDLRLEHEGTLPSWAVPKGLPDVPGPRHLAVQTEDHPLGYLDFEGEIPHGEYGGGPVRIWDSGTYEASEWREDKVTFRLHGRRHSGTYHLFRTGGGEDRQWLVIRRDEPAPGELPPPPPRLEPMLATPGEAPFDDPAWRFEIKWDGIRALATVTRPGTGADGETRLQSRAGNDITPAYPELAPLWERVLARNAVLDGEIVAFTPQGVPSFERLQQRMHVRDAAAIGRLRARTPVTFLVFDVLALDGEPLCDLPLTERLARLESVFVPGGPFLRSDATPEHGTALYEAARARGLEGIVAKRADSRYLPGRRTKTWLKIKVRQTVDVRIGGWVPGEGGRRGQLGALLVGEERDGDLVYLARVGSGFDAAELERVGALLRERARETSPFEGEPAPPREGRWVEPDLRCRVEFTERTSAGVLRAPTYQGLIEP